MFSTWAYSAAWEFPRSPKNSRRSPWFLPTTRYRVGSRGATRGLPPRRRTSGNDLFVRRRRPRRVKLVSKLVVYAWARGSEGEDAAGEWWRLFTHILGCSCALRRWEWRLISRQLSFRRGMEPCTHRVFSTNLYTRPLSTDTSQVTSLFPRKIVPIAGLY